ncbi:MAG: zinc-binding alcohol dehydrogenase family protein [Coriobacteriales bacterium]
MKAIVIYEPGGPEKLLYEDVPTPEVRPGWSLVRVRGFGINHSEIFTRKGLSPTVRFPRILGIECVGEVAQTTDPERLPIGQTVVSLMGEMGRAFDGSYAEYVLLPNGQVYPLQSELPWEQLAALPETYYTAFGSVTNLHVEPGDAVLVRGATSGVGIAALRLVKSRYPDVAVDGTSRNASKNELLLEEGFDHVIVDQDNRLQTSRVYDKVLELIGPATLRDTFAHTREGGVVCSTGQLGGAWYLDDHFDPIMDLPANGYLTSFYSGNVSRERLQAMVDYVSAYHVDVRPEKVFALEQVPDAHRYLDEARGHGKVVVVV